MRLDDALLLPPNAGRETRSIAPRLVWAWCQAAIWCRQRMSVRPSRRISGGQSASCRSWPRRITHSKARAGSVWR